VRLFRGFRADDEFECSQIIGDCLGPALPSGTMVWISKTATWADGDVVGVVVPDPPPMGPWICLKQIWRHKLPPGQTVWILLSANQPAIYLHRDCTVIGPVVAAVKLDGWPTFDPRTEQSNAEREAMTPTAIAEIRRNGNPIVYADLRRYAA
jgi:hypothetical protein